MCRDRGNFLLSRPLASASILKVWLRRRCRFIASETSSSIFSMSEIKTLVSAPIPPRSKFVFSPKASERRREYRAGRLGSRQPVSLLQSQRAGADRLWYGNCQQARYTITQYCGFGSRVQINGIGRRQVRWLARRSSPLYGLLMLNSANPVSVEVWS